MAFLKKEKKQQFFDYAVPHNSFFQHSMNTQREFPFPSWFYYSLKEKQGVIQISIYISNVFLFSPSPPFLSPFCVDKKRIHFTLLVVQE